MSDKCATLSRLESCFMRKSKDDKMILFNCDQAVDLDVIVRLIYGYGFHSTMMIK